MAEKRGDRITVKTTRLVTGQTNYGVSLDQKTNVDEALQWTRFIAGKLNAGTVVIIL